MSDSEKKQRAGKDASCRPASAATGRLSVAASGDRVAFRVKRHGIGRCPVRVSQDNRTRPYSRLRVQGVACRDGYDWHIPR